MTFLDDDSLVQQWLGRIAVTIVLALAWHWYPTPLQTPFMDHGKRLMEAPERHSRNRSKLLDSLERNKEPVEEEQEEEQCSSSQEEKEERKRINEGSGEEASSVPEIVLPPAANSCFVKELSQAAGAASLPSPTKATTSNIISGSRIQPQPVATATSIHRTQPIKAIHSEHPGLHGFTSWYEVEASLYRVYTIGKANGQEVAPSFIPRSERGHVPLKLEILNSMYRTVDVFWVDYKGKEILRGTIKNGSVFNQTTWIGHPWTFRCKDTGQLVLHFIPYRVIPTTDAVPTTDPDDPALGRHTFALQRPSTTELMCSIQDPVFPLEMETTQQAVTWCFQQMSRLDYMYATTLIKYLTNIVRHPKESKYRQIRIAGKTFYHQVWNTPARGLLLAAGFVEEGPFAELGSMNPLPRNRVQDLSTLLYYLEIWNRTHEQGGTPKEQPNGADGGGRANFGRAGQMN